MIETIMDLQMSEHARFQYSTLRSDDQRTVDAGFEHLRHWQDDDYVRSRSKRLESNREVYMFRPGADYAIAFEVVGDEIVVLSIFSEETVRKFNNPEIVAP